MTETKRDYRDTLFLPQTDFPMRAGLPKKEPEWLEFWNKMGLFERLREQSKDRKHWILHDGPPYANGNIHMGTAMNKILKDIIVKSHQMLGYNSHYVPGWDCHGLPIEWKVEEEFRSKGRAKNEVPASEFRTRCREYAAHWLDIQREEFKRLGVIGDWDEPYKTMNFQSEADICAELLKIAKTGQLYLGSKPVMWSPVEQTALAEAEIEYHERKATQIYVKFPVRGTESHIVIWTTTPWTIPANRAVSYSEKIKYGLYQVTEMEEAEFEPWSKPGDRLIVADDLWEKVSKAGLIKSAERLDTVTPAVLDDMVLDHPLKNMEGNEGKYDFPVPLLAGDHVTAEAGTGFVHTAPSHGEDDFNVWMNNTAKIEALGGDPAVPMTMDDAGCYTDVMPTRFQGLDVIRTSGKKRGQDGKANAEAIKALMECGKLLGRGIMMLRDAHSWRSKAPVVRRATPQWFISMSKGDLRGKALAAIDKTAFYPSRGKNRLYTMVADRPDWLISRQRAWGVPITLIIHEDGTLHTDRDDADEINARILAAVEKSGVDGWFDTPLEELMDGDTTGWTKVTDILDVWFDSGSTHAFCLKRRDDLPDRADLYLEGTDQHRGWFHSSLLESCAVYGEAPYDNVLTHGFVVDDKGIKMSKLLGNTIKPQDLIKQYGADIIRLWTASSDFTEDLRVGPEIIKTNVDAYRKIRNTLRYMIGALGHFDADKKVDHKDMPALERWVLHRLAELDAEVRAAYRVFDLKRVFSLLFNFINTELSAFFFDIRKDSSYCDPANGTRRLSYLTVLDALFARLTTWFAPILSFTMEEVWQTRFPNDDWSVHMEVFPDTPEGWKDETLAAHMTTLQEFRDAVNEAIEPLRKEDVIRSSLEAKIVAPAEDALVKALSGMNITRKDVYDNPAEPNDTLADMLIVSDVDLSANVEAISVSSLKEDTAYRKCERSWKYFKPAGDEDITPRDSAAIC